MDFKTLLSPCPLGIFLDEHFGRRVLHLPGNAGKLSALVPQDYAERAQSQGDEDGAGEILESLTILAEDVERELEAPVRVKMVRVTDAVELHRIERDVLVLQVIGHADGAIHEDSDGAAKEAPLWRDPVRSGDALYVPRGLWLAMQPTASSSLQVRLEIGNPTGADLLEWIAGHVKPHPAFQADIPRFSDPAARWEYIRELRRVLAKMMRDPRLLEWYRRETNLKVQATSRLHAMPWSDAVPGTGRIALLPLRKPRIKRAGLETLLLVTMGKRLAFPVDAAPLLHYVCDRATFTVDEFFLSFENEFERGELSDFLAVLGKEGVVGLRVPQTPKMGPA